MNAGPTSTAFHLGYRPWLDGLRGVAILMVLAYHLGLLPGGFLGVDLFFVLSGFLITTLLVEEWQRRGSIHLGGFYLRRGLRLVPAFLALLLACFLVTWFFRPKEERAGLGSEMAIAACYVANWPNLHQTNMPRLGHTWSLSVEEQFYLLWPALLGLMLYFNLGRRRILMVVCLGIVACAGLRMGLYSLHRGSPLAKSAIIPRLYCGLDTRGDSLLIGCLTGLVTAWKLLPASRRFRLWTTVFALVSVFGLSYLALFRTMDHSQFYHGLFTVVALMAAAILLWLLAGSAPWAERLLGAAPLVGIGRISYSLYLVHIPIMFWLQPIPLGWGHPANLFLVTGLSLAAAVLSYFCVERPCLRLKLRWQTTNSKTPEAMEPSTDGHEAQRAAA